MVSSKYDPLGNGKLVWYYRLSPNVLYSNTTSFHVNLVLIVESCDTPVQFIVKTIVNNTQSSKTLTDIAEQVQKGSQIVCMNNIRDRFFSADSITFNVKIFVVEEYKCTEVPHMNIFQPQSNLVKNFAQLFEDKQFSDVKIIIDEKEFLAHKAILAVRSSVFRAMFQNEMIESKQNQVTITDMKPEIFAELLRFIYTDCVQGLDKIALELLQAADKYDLEQLKIMCEKALCANISEQTAIQMLITADLYRAGHLKQATIGFIERNANVLNSEEWKGLWVTNFDLANQTVCEVLKLRKL